MIMCIIYYTRIYNLYYYDWYFLSSVVCISELIFVKNIIVYIIGN